jgi:integrase
MLKLNNVLYVTSLGPGYSRKILQGDTFPVHAMAQRLIEAYLSVAGHGADAASPVFRPVTNNRTKELEKPLNQNSIYRNIILKHGLETSVSAEVNGLCVHSLRATAATNALSHEADIAKVQEWLGHANVSITRLYDRRKVRPEDSPTFRVKVLILRKRVTNSISRDRSIAQNGFGGTNSWGERGRRHQCGRA